MIRDFRHEEEGTRSWTAAIIGSLPDLDYLRVSSFAATTWTKEMTLNLPRSLLQLHLFSTNMASTSLSVLPPNLQHLYYVQNLFPELDPDFNWRGEDFVHLPRSLHTLYIHAAAEVNDQHLALLKPNLQRFCSYEAPKLTKNALRFLPTHCELGGYGYAALSQVYTPLSKSMLESHLYDPDPRVIGLPYPWPI